MGMKITLSAETIDAILAIQADEERSGIDQCDAKLSALWHALMDDDISGPLATLLEANGFSEPNMPYTIGLYGNELSVIADGLAETYIIEPRK